MNITQAGGVQSPARSAPCQGLVRGDRERRGDDLQEEVVPCQSLTSLIKHSSLSKGQYKDLSVPIDFLSLGPPLLTHIFRDTRGMVAMRHPDPVPILRH